MVPEGFVILAVLVQVQSADAEIDFDVDYYFSSPLRSTDSCGSSKIFCQILCGNKHVLCFSGKCYCVDIKESIVDSHKESDDESPTYDLRPTVRHHIAHFCPNLEVARACIRKCMKIGLPSFCGKDHVCYCGHKYKNTDINPKTNAHEVHNQFKDLYSKYFGPDLRDKNYAMKKITDIDYV